MDYKIYECDEEMKKENGRKYKYFVMFANETKMLLFTNKKIANVFIKSNKEVKK